MICHQRKIGNVSIKVEALPEHTPISMCLSDDYAREKAEQAIEAGEMVYFCAKVTVSYGPFSGFDYLGCCIYDDYRDFLRPGDYFRQMVSDAICQIRKDAAAVRSMKFRV